MGFLSRRQIAGLDLILRMVKLAMISHLGDRLQGEAKRRVDHGEVRIGHVGRFRGHVQGLQGRIQGQGPAHSTIPRPSAYQDDAEQSLDHGLEHFQSAKPRRMNNSSNVHCKTPHVSFLEWAKDGRISSRLQPRSGRNLTNPKQPGPPANTAMPEMCGHVRLQPELRHSIMALSSLATGRG